MNNNERIPLGHQIGSLGKIFKNELKEISEKRGINSTYCKIIMILSRNREGVIQNDIVENTNFKPSTVSLTLKNLEQMGYLTRESSPEDSRKIVVKITDLVLQYDHEIRECFGIVEEEMIKGISEEEIAIFEEIVLKMRKNLLHERGEN